MRNRSFKWLLIIWVSALWISGCRLNVKRGDDGVLRVTTSIAEEKLQKTLAAAISDPATQNLTIDLRDGDALITGQRKRPKGDQFDTLSFVLKLSVQDGQLKAAISDVQINGKGVQGDAVESWSEKIVQWIEGLGDQKRPNSSLESVAIGNDQITLVWRIQKKTDQSP